MTGIFGGVILEDILDEMATSVGSKPWYEHEEVSDGAYQIGIVHHGDRDSDGHTVWRNGSQFGFVYGAISNLKDRGLTHAEMFSSVLADPEDTLADVDGPFVLVCGDSADERVILATDKIGTRPCYYSVDDQQLVFGSQLKSLLTCLEEPAIDLQAVNDLLLLGHLWGDETLLEGVRMLPPASTLVFDDGMVSTRRYWCPSFGESRASKQYLHDLVNTYRDSVAAMAETISDSTGLWLSGGLDSRSMGAELVRNMEMDDHPPFLEAFTYDSNPRGAGNPELASSIASTLGIPIEEVEMTPERLVSIIDKAVDNTDGMVSWHSLANLSNAYHISEPPGVMLEACGQGEFLGEHIKRYHLTKPDSVTESQYESEALNDASTVALLLEADVEPMQTLEEEARRTTEDDFASRVLETHFNNHYSRFVFASNPMARKRSGTRIPFAHSKFLEHVAKLPREFRMGTYPFSKGKIPYGTSKPKLHLIRVLHPELAEITYERTQLEPARSYQANIAGFFASTVVNQIRGQTTHSGEGNIARWIREHDTLRKYVEELLDDACKRKFLDADDIRELKEEHMSGEADHLSLIGPLTTLERWLQMHVDDTERAEKRNKAINR